ncbi:unnamed protein product [Cochlearia groenlandica]
MTLKGGTSGACAACKYQRRRCASDCPLAPYFPAENPKLFQNVHRLFGVRSIVKILEGLDETQKPEAMKSIIFQSYVRDRSPVHGCLGVINQLQYMIMLAEEELKSVNSQLQLYRSSPQNQEEDVVVATTTSQLDLGMGLTVNNNNDVATFFSPLQQQQQQQMSYSYSCSEVNTNGYNSPHDHQCKDHIFDNNCWCQNNQITCNNNNNDDVMEIQSQLVNLQMATNKHKEEDDAHKYDEIHQFLDIIDDRQSFADSKEAYASSSGEALKEHNNNNNNNIMIDEIGGNEMRNVATCFSLTSVN